MLMMKTVVEVAITPVLDGGDGRMNAAVRAARGVAALKRSLHVDTPALPAVPQRPAPRFVPADRAAHGRLPPPVSEFRCVIAELRCTLRETWALLDRIEALTSTGGLRRRCAR